MIEPSERSDFFCANKNCSFYLKPCPVEWDDVSELLLCKACYQSCHKYKIEEEE